MKRFDKKRLIYGALIVALVLCLAIPPAFAAEVWQQKFARFSAIAGETLSIGDVVCIKAADSQAYKADADDASLRPAVGVIGKGGVVNTTVEIITSGILAGQAAMSPGYRIYLSNTAGAMTMTEPTNPQILGWVMPGTVDTATSTTYYIDVRPQPSTGAAY